VSSLAAFPSILPAVPHEPFPGRVSESTTTATWSARAPSHQIGKPIARGELDSRRREEAADMTLGLAPDAAARRRAEERPAAGIVDRIEDKGHEVKEEVKELGREVKEKGREIKQAALREGREVKEDVKGAAREMKKEAKDLSDAAWREGREVKEDLKGEARRLSDAAWREGREAKEELKGFGREIKGEARDLRDSSWDQGRRIEEGIRDQGRRFEEGLRREGRELRDEGREVIDRTKSRWEGGGRDIDATRGGYYGEKEDYSRLSPQELVRDDEFFGGRKEKFPAASPGRPAEPVNYPYSEYTRDSRGERERARERSEWDDSIDQWRAATGGRDQWQSRTWNDEEDYNARRYTAAGTGSRTMGNIEGMTSIEQPSAAPSPATVREKQQAMPKAGSPGSVEGVPHKPTSLGGHGEEVPSSYRLDRGGARSTGTGTSRSTGHVGGGFDASGIYHDESEKYYGGSNQYSLAGPPSEPGARSFGRNVNEQQQQQQQQQSWSSQGRWEERQGKQPQDLNPLLGDKQPPFDLSDRDHDPRAGYYGQRRIAAPHDEQGNLLPPSSASSSSRNPNISSEQLSDQEQWKARKAWENDEAAKLSRIPSASKGGSSGYILDHTAAEHAYGQALQRQRELQYQSRQREGYGVGGGDARLR
jgi:hypothetical protein